MPNETGKPATACQKSWKAGWEDQAANTLAASLAATPAQRLEWLEEAVELAWRSGALAPLMKSER